MTQPFGQHQSFASMTDEQLRAIALKPHGVDDWMDSTIQSNRRGASLELAKRAKWASSPATPNTEGKSA